MYTQLKRQKLHKHTNTPAAGGMCNKHQQKSEHMPSAKCWMVVNTQHTHSTHANVRKESEHKKEKRKHKINETYSTINSTRSSVCWEWASIVVRPCFATNTMEDNNNKNISHFASLIFFLFCYAMAEIKLRLDQEPRQNITTTFLIAPNILHVRTDERKK